MKAGWLIKRFDDVLEIRNGKNQREVESKDGEYPIFGSAGNVMGYATSFICEAGTTIIGRKGNINTPIYSETNFWNVDTAFGLAVKPGLDRKFLYYYCLSFDFSVLNRGTTIPSLVKSELLGISIPVPPLPEQRRIVTILDEAFGGIATAKANAEKNLQNARAIFESYLQSVFIETRNMVSLAKIASDITDGDHMPPPKATAGIHFITISNILKRTRAIDFGNTFLVSPEYFTRLKQNRRPQLGDVLYTVTGATLGIPVLVDHHTEFCFQRHIALIRPRPGINSVWLSYLMSSPQVFAQATAGATGAAQKTVSLAALRNIMVPLHSEKEQINVAARLSKLFAQTYKLEDLYNAKFSALDELKKSLLHRAFNGDL